MTLNKSTTKSYETDASGLRGKAKEVIFPNSIPEVQKIVTITPKIVPRGGGTGLAGGAVPQNGQDTVLDLSKLTRIQSLDKERSSIEVEAGVILDDLQHHLKRYNLEFPVNPSSHTIATIGGMIATDAVGSRAIKYGRTSKWVKWVDIVDSQGNLQRKGATELSDYAGMEGTTGVIVKACLKLSPRKLRTASLVPLETVKETLALVRQLKLDSSVSMMEFMDKRISKDLGLEERYHLIVEYESDKGKIKDGAYEKLLALRDRTYPLLASEGYTRIEDPKILTDRFDKIMPWFESKNIPVFGHLGVGILHPCFNHDQEKFIPEMMKLVRKLGGQISGEHGIGLLKKSFIEPNDKKILVNIKKRTDPINKFNQGKVI
ncbi:FAD-binding oxidoreductase [archaeon]|jgi:glycolate oxidase|nr:FAD-binding oxidoreductase [archaeon]MBT3577226.1 FAD-binding oxidoreductase [archaeon]MBT6820235.1 FAD-binding oxidoreductase [archaeon]MBT6956734.1 FAD-binding oxidoreductase [archaeon]MBT7025439.1 FAD-binding oxidoreductase [archaeon]